MTGTNTMPSIAEKIQSFSNFIYYYHKLAGLSEPTQSQYEIAGILEDCAVFTDKVKGNLSDICPNRISDKVFINTFRGFGKSHLASLFVSWLLYRNKNLKTLIVSGTNSKGTELSHHILQTIRLLPELQHLAPKDKQDRAGSKSFDIAGIIPKQQPSVSCTSISSNNTGKRADVLILDDIETLSSAYSHAEKEGIKINLQELTGAILSPNALVVVLGTFQSEKSIYLDMISKGYSPFFLPVAYPDIDYKYSKYLLPNILSRNSQQPSQPLDRFNKVEIRKRKQEYTEESFALQFMLDTSKSDKATYLFDLGGIPLVQQYGNNKIMVIDPAAGGGDASAYIILAYGDGKISILESGDCGGYDDGSMSILLSAMRKYNIKDIKVEKNFGAGMYSLLLSKYLTNKNYSAKVEDFNSTGNKEARISETLQPSFQQNLIAFSNSYYDLQDNPRSLRYQLKYFTGKKACLEYDDMIDCLSMGVNLIQSSSVIPDKNLQRLELARQENEMRKAIYGNKFQSNFITNRM